jgi:low affinity Fe/Cu permease
MASKSSVRILHIQTSGSKSIQDKMAKAVVAKTSRTKPATKQTAYDQQHPPRHQDNGIGQSEASAIARGFTAFANHIAHLAGRPVTFVLCCLIIVVWGASGPIFHYSDTWQLIINTGTTIITFLMVFLIQNTQNRDGAAVQAKLDELIRAVEGARNHFIGIEHLTEEQLDAIRALCEKDAEVALAAEAQLEGEETDPD